MGGKTENVKRESQASPLADSLLSKLRKQLESDAFGTGVGPLQRQAGNATQKLLTSLGDFDVDLEGNLGDFIKKLEGFDSSVNAKETDAQAKGIEGFGELDSQIAALLASGGFDVNAKEDAAQTRGVKGFGELESQIAELLASGGLDVNAREQGQQTQGKGNINKLISSLFGGTEGGPSRGNERLIRGLESRSKSRTDRSAADLREQGGIFGTRFGTSLATGDALLRSEADASLDQTIGALLEQGRQFDTAQLQEAIDKQFGQGTSLRDQDFRNLQTSQENRFRGRDQRSDVLSRLFGAGTTLRDQDFRNKQTSQDNRFRARDQRSGVLSSLFGSGSTLRDQDYRNQQSTVGNDLSRLGLLGNTLHADFDQKQAKAQFGLDLNEQQLNIINSLFSQGQANIQPFLQLATLGILPEEIIKSPGFADYLTSLAGGVASVATASIVGS